MYLPKLGLSDNVRLNLNLPIQKYLIDNRFSSDSAVYREFGKLCQHDEVLEFFIAQHSPKSRRSRYARLIWSCAYMTPGREKSIYSELQN